MSRKTGADSHKALNDVIGIVLLGAALVLLISQWSYDPHDLKFYQLPHNDPLHNWGYVVGAYSAWITFVLLGVTAYLLPLVFALFGVAYLLNICGHLREKLRWALLWMALLFVSFSGLAYLFDN